MWTPCGLAHLRFLLFSLWPRRRRSTEDAILDITYLFSSFQAIAIKFSQELLQNSGLNSCILSGRRRAVGRVDRRRCCCEER